MNEATRARRIERLRAQYKRIEERLGELMSQRADIEDKIAALLVLPRE